MKATPNLNFTVVKPTEKSLKLFVTMLRSIYQNLVNVINGNLGFGDGTLADNVNGVWINVVAPVAPNTDFTVTHNLNRLPVGYWPMRKDRACDVYTGSIAATKTQLTLRATVASAVLRLFVVTLLLGLLACRGYAQGASHQNFAAVAVNTAVGSGTLKVIPSALITVCNGALLPPAGTACIGTASVFADNALTLSISNPFNADIRGNYIFFAAAGQNYVVSVGGVGVTTYSYVWVAPLVAGGASNLTPGNCVQAGTNGALTTIAFPCGTTGGTVTSVSAGGFAPLFTTSVATPSTTPVITNTAISQYPNTFYAGASGTAIDLIDFPVVTATGTASPISISATPKYSGDFALLSTIRDDTGNVPNFTPDVSWTASVNNSALQEWFYKDISGLTPATASGAIGTTSPNWSAALALFTNNGSAPALTNQSIIQSGAWTSFTNSAIGFTPTAGRTLIVSIMSGEISFNGGPFGVLSFTDSAGDIFAPIGSVVNNTGRGTEIVLLAASNIVGGATTFSNILDQSIGNGVVQVFEVTNLAPVTNFLPNFRRIVGKDIPYPTLVSLGGVFSKAFVANQFLTSIGRDGTIGQAQPSFSNLSGVATGAQLPASTSNCTGTNFAQGMNAGFTPICVAAPVTTGQVFSATTLGGDIAVSATTQTDVLARTITMPSSGCPCRVSMAYSIYITTASSGVGYSAWVNDGSVNMAGTNNAQSNGSSGALTNLTISWMSTVTYTNNTVVTFTLRTEGDHTYTVRAASQLAGSAPNSSFQVMAVTSN